MRQQEEQTSAVRPRDPFYSDISLSRPSLIRQMMGDLWSDAPRISSADLPIPAIDIAENDNAYVVTAELAGCKPDDVSVEVHEGVLSIRGEKKSERSEETEQSRWTERSFGSFHRSFRLAPDASQDKIDASFKNGVLTVKVEKTEENKPKVVRVKA
jgi:HSP20 family molecular chaperone IbpA